MSTDDDIGSANTALGTPTPTPTPSQPGGAAAGATPTRIAERYEVLALLGAGGMGRVYRAHDRTLDEIVALKLLRRELLDTPGMIERFRQEVKLARRVTHANVVRTFDFGQHGADHFLTMEYIEGRSLAQQLDGGRLAHDELLRIARAACAGIAAAHAAGVLHRDLKPDNILVAHTGRIAITDFGIAQITSDPEAHERFVGTPAYMAPEQVSAGAPIGPAVDVYAFGAILFEMLTGRRPFTGADPVALALARLEQPPPDPRRHGDVPEALALLVLRCLARDPAARFADGGALGAALAVVELARVAHPPTASASVPGRSSRSVALMPLRATEDLAEIADGLSEEITDALTMTRELRVRSLGSVRAAAKADASAEAVGRELGVDVVVDGSVRRRGDKLRLAARAIGAVDGFQLWASHVDTDLGGLLSAGDEIARAIARALTVEIDVPVRRATDARVAELYLESKARLRLGWASGDVEPVIAELEPVVRAESDPGLIALLAAAYARSAFYGQAARLVPARELAARAVALAPGSSDAHLALGVTCLYGLDVAGAGRSIARAVSRAPGNVNAQAALGAILLEADLLDEGIVHLEAAQAIDPIGTHTSDLPRAYVYAGREAENEALYAALSPPYNSRGFVELQRARYAMWRGELYELAVDPSTPPYFQQYVRAIRGAHAARTLTPAELAVLDSMASVASPRLRATRTQFGVEILTFVGDHDAALVRMQQSVDAGLQDLCWVRRCALLAPLRPRAEFQRLAAIVEARAREVIAGVREGLAS